MPTGAFVVRRNGKVFVTGNSGFPKSHDIGKAIDKQKHKKDDTLRFTLWLREQCEALGISKNDLDEAAGTSDMGGWWTSNLPHRCAIPTAEQWESIAHFFPALPDWAVPLIAPANQPGEAWEKREITQHATRELVQGDAISFDQRSSKERERRDIPATPDAARWDGWGTALKPAIEPIILARKPLDGTVAQNVLAHGVGGLNIDACRVGTDEDRSRPPRTPNTMYGGGRGTNLTASESNPAGRFPANVLLDEHAATEMDRQSGVSVSRANTSSDNRGAEGSHIFASRSLGRRDPSNSHNDSGGASRFFPVFKYQAKAPKKERPVIEREDGSKIQHPTVKPLALMEWLVTLTTPEGGLVLDPFAGTGTTLQAARGKGFNAIGIEQDPDYIRLIETRLAAEADGVLF